jgi:HlyD family secretion protein
MTDSPSRAPQLPAQPRPEDVLKVVTQGQRSRKWARLGVGVLLVASVLGGVLWWQRRAAEPPRVRFQTATVTAGDLHETVTAVGTLNPVDAVELGAEVTGKLVKVNVDVNDVVTVGQVLAEIDPEQLQARVQEAAASLNNAVASQRSAEASLAEADLKAERTQALFGRGLTSSQELETAQATAARSKASVAASKAQVTVAQAGVASAKTALSRALIVAPIAGVVLARNVEQGQTLTAGFTTPVLFTLGRALTELELKVEVDEADIGKVQEGQTAKFSVDAYPNQEFDARLFKLHSLPTKVEGVTSNVVTYSAVLAVKNPEKLLRPGMTATATITTRTLSGVLLVPNTALRFEPPKPSSGSRGFLPIPGMRGGGMRPPGEGPGADVLPKGDRVWIEAAGKPKPVSIEILGTDGVNSAVKPLNQADGFDANTQVLVDVLAESPS